MIEVDPGRFAEMVATALDGLPGAGGNSVFRAEHANLRAARLAFGVAAAGL